MEKILYEKLKPGDLAQIKIELCTDGHYRKMLPCDQATMKCILIRRFVEGGRQSLGISLDGLEAIQKVPSWSVYIEGQILNILECDLTKII